MSIYISSAAQISIQQPLSEEWMHHPIYPDQRMQKAIDPDFRQFISPKDSRRMGRLMKRAIATAHSALQSAHRSMVDAIVTGTGLGCIENTEHFLNAMIHDGESLLTPTFFIHSTHNMVSSQIALNLKCHGYNSTYTQQGTSFESALYDVYQQFLLHRISSALVGGHDEMTPAYFEMLDNISFWGNPQQQLTASESAVSMVLSNQSTPDSWCRLDAMNMLYRPSKTRFHDAIRQIFIDAQLAINDIDTVVIGTNGIAQNDEVYQAFLSHFNSNIRVVNYKPLFGEGFSVSGLGIYAAAAMLHHHFIPSQMLVSGDSSIPPRHILFYNHFQNRHHSLVLLSSC